MDPVLHLIISFVLLGCGASGLYWVIQTLRALRRGPVSTKVLIQIEPETKKGTLREMCPYCHKTIRHYDFKAKFPTFEQWTVRREIKDASLSA